MASIELISNDWGSSYGDEWKVHEIHFGWAGAVTQFYNASDKDIKYVTFRYAAYNAVGDLVLDKSNNGIASGRLVGPILPDYVVTVTFKDLWNSNLVKRIKIDEVFVEFMDGTTETISGNELVSVCIEAAIIRNGKVGPRTCCYFKDISTFNPESFFYKKHAEEIEQEHMRRQADEKAKKEKAAREKEESERRRAEFLQKQEEEKKEKERRAEEIRRKREEEEKKAKAKAKLQGIIVCAVIALIAIISGIAGACS